MEMRELNCVELLGLTLLVSALFCFVVYFPDYLMRLCYSDCSLMHDSLTNEDY